MIVNAWDLNKWAADFVNQRKIDHRDIAMLFYIIAVMDRKTRVATIPQQDAAEDFGCDRKGIAGRLRRLEACGAIRTVKPGMSHRPGTYRVLYQRSVLEHRLDRRTQARIAAKERREDYYIPE